MENTFGRELYNNLQNLVKNNETFYDKVFEMDGGVYIIYNYRLASWGDFDNPGAKSARGIMFEIDENRNFLRVASLPPDKFFNYEEGNVNHKKFKMGDKMVKMDGSLISTYIHKNELLLKSKTSLNSSQAVDAMNFLNKNKTLKNELCLLAKKGTVNLEFTAPQHRIVIPYQEEKLTVLSYRLHKNGHNFFASNLKKILEDNNLNESLKNLVHFDTLKDKNINQDEFLKAVHQEQTGEGYVIEMLNPENNEENYLVKIKNLKYIALHHTKDSIKSSKRLFEAVIEESTDDLRLMFADDNFSLDRIEEMEAKVRPIYNHMINTVEKFNLENKNLLQKEFALKAKKEEPVFFSLIMNHYNGKNNDYKTYAKKHMEDIFKVKSEIIDNDEEEIINHKKLIRRI